MAPRERRTCTALVQPVEPTLRRGRAWNTARGQGDSISARFTCALAERVRAADLERRTSKTVSPAPHRRLNLVLSGSSGLNQASGAQMAGRWGRPQTLR